MIRAALRILVPLVLIAALGAMGQARAQAALGMALARAGVTHVICGADGPEIVTLDPRGQPVADPAADCGTCPDCLSPAAVPSSLPAVAVRDAVSRPAGAVAVPALRPVQPAVAACPARAPPEKA